MAITIQDIAQKARVSHSTVSRAVRGNSVISEKTRKLIQETALELGCLPSTAARSLKTNPSQAVVCFNDMIAIGILKGLGQRGIQVPAEFSVAGFDNIVFSNNNVPERKVHVLRGKLLVRKSTAPPPPNIR